ncbi:ATP-binding protein [Gordonia neofelifaecis]|nr:ATP-binding protein [Gordonia neofelifaecis]
MRRGVAVCMAITTLIVPTIMVSYYDQVISLVAVWWVPVSIVLVVGAAAALLADATRGSGRLIGPLALTLGAANVTVVVLWLIAWTGDAAPPSYGSPPIWPANTVVLPAIVMATVYRARVPVLYAGFVLLLLATAQQYVKQGQFGVLGYANSLLTAALVGVFLTLEYSTMRAVRAADERREQVLSASARAASRAARVAERERLDIVVRDKVIAVLRQVSEGVPEPRLQAKATQTLADLDGRSRSRPPPAEMSVAETSLRLREAVNAVADDPMTELTVLDPDAHYPYRLGEALVDAAAEAVGNAVAHAGPTAACALIGVFDSDLIRLRVVDDGVGFDPRRIPADRAGVELGILRRMREQPGGGAWIDSSTTGGTMVSLHWRRP